MSLGQALLARATREHANGVVIDRRNEPFDPWIADLLGAAVASGAQRALAHTSSLTLELERMAWTWEHGLMVGVRSLVRCVKNKLAAPGAEAELDRRYPVGPLLPQIAAPVEVEREMGDGWAGTEHDSGQAVAALVRCHVHRPGGAVLLPQSLIAAEAET